MCEQCNLYEGSKVRHRNSDLLGLWQLVLVHPFPIVTSSDQQLKENYR